MARRDHRPTALWQAVRLRPVTAAADPDCAPRTAWIPFGWDDAAAAAVCALADGGSIRVDALADHWLGRLPGALAAQAHALLLARRLAPAEAVWRGGVGGMVVNVAAFHEPGSGLDGLALAEAARIAAEACLHLGGSRLDLADLDLLLALDGVAFDSPAARRIAGNIAGLLTAAIDPASGMRLGASVAGPVDALLGVETAGIAPAFGPLRADGGLTRAARARIAALGLTSEAALAATLAGAELLPPATDAAHAAMHAALSATMTLSPLRLPSRRPVRLLPSHAGGLARRVSIGGQRVFLRTGEFADGTPGEVTVALPQASPTARGWAEAFGHVLSLALQHGATVADVAVLLANTRFGPAGLVEGDAAVHRATSPADYLARTLVAAYAPGLALPGPELADEPPLLPLELPRLRLVG